MTDKHTAEHSNSTCLGVDWFVCDVYIAHTTIKPEVSISLIQMPFLVLQVQFYTSKICVPLNATVLTISTPYVISVIVLSSGVIYNNIPIHQRFSLT